MIKLPGIDSIDGITGGHKIASHGKDLVGVTACVKEMAHAFLHAGGLPGPVEQIGQACAHARSRRIFSGDRFCCRLRLALLSFGATRDDLIGFRVNFADSLGLEHDIVSEFLVITILPTLNIGHATLVTDLDFSDFDGEFGIHINSLAK